MRRHGNDWIVDNLIIVFQVEVFKSCAKTLQKTAGRMSAEGDSVLEDRNL